MEVLLIAALINGAGFGAIALGSRVFRRYGDALADLADCVLILRGKPPRFSAQRLPKARLRR